MISAALTNQTKILLAEHVMLDHCLRGLSRPALVRSRSIAAEVGGLHLLRRPIHLRDLL